mmetsp:Transcript_8290/g.15617  ORF Transcript_8290/g.15617 Transcript_8290/m.15617 type:complete len:401 (+) Transcript_8290:582-1784(+)|eukprot:CAMPEP_0176485340 /NCGR_PEP_ID=MMETSP0200_2-20121128/4987_1 /TAXON_ID=947934 /ORGANISM="Chaetoceros sp., Strain GSL56" /LENGTH=400 /DNA_ID=CAMNT_0017881977 /DNA_START=575 /DNA_END=1777 /DNA_ORIENTATION=+
MEEEGRRAAHVKWDGKTIALGTFSVAEAVEKCERAKALTKKWRASMIPKPDVEWVKKALERLNIRVVNDRPGRRRKEEIQEKLRRTASTSNNSVASSLPSSLLNAPYSSAQNMSGRQSPPQEYAKTFSNDSYPGRRLPDSRPMGSYGIEGTTNVIPGGKSDFVTSSYMTGEYKPMDNGSALAIRNSRFSNRDSNRYHAHNYNVTSLSGRSNPPGLDSAAESRRHYEILKDHHANLMRELQQTTDMMQLYQNNYEQIEQESLDVMNTPVYGSSNAPMMLHTTRQDSSSASFHQTHSVGSNEQMYYPYDYPDGRNTLRATHFPASQASNFNRADHMGLQTHDQNTNSRGVSQYKAPMSNVNSSARITMYSSLPNVETSDQYRRLKYNSFSEQEHIADFNFEK